MGLNRKNDRLPRALPWALTERPLGASDKVVAFLLKRLASCAITPTRRTTPCKPPLPNPHHDTATPTRNRIKSHRKIRAGDLVPHEWNFRLHPEAQKAALQAIYQEIGFARSLLAYELPDGRLKLIDGHLRRDLDPNLEVDVEVLDVE